jgi:hypothetical protein
LHPDSFTAECVVPFLEPYLEQRCNILHNRKEGHQYGVKDIFPKYNLELVIKHHNSDRVPNKHKHLIVNVGMLVDVSAHRLSRVVVLRTA